MEKDSDQILVERVQAGQRQAYEILINRYYRRVYGMCMGIVCDRHDSQDLCQDAIMQAYLRIHTLRSGNRFGSWLTEIAKNLCFDWLRKKSRNRELTSQMADSMAVTGKCNPFDDVAEAVSQLPMELRMPLTLYYLDGCSCRSVSQQLGISHASVWRRLRKAKQQMHQLLSEVKNEI